MLRELKWKDFNYFKEGCVTVSEVVVSEPSDLRFEVYPLLTIALCFEKTNLEKGRYYPIV